MNRLSLAFVHRRYGGSGGVERNVALLTERMQERGHDVTVICSRVDVEPPPEVTVHRVRGNGLLRFDRAAKQALESNRYDVVQGFDFTTRQDVLRVGRGLLAVYGPMLDATRGPLGRWWKSRSRSRRVQLELEQRMFSDPATKFVAVSHIVKREIIDTYALAPERVAVVHNGVELEKFSTDQRDAVRNDVRKRLSIPDDAPVVLFVGTGFRRKGLMVLIEAVARLHPKYPELRLVVAGRDGRSDLYRRRAHQLGIQQAMVWCGSRDDVASLYHAADVVALPSRYEPFGNVVLEAMACGVAVLPSDRCGASELFQGELAQWVMPTDDVDAWAKGLGTLVGDPTTRMRAVDMGLKQARSCTPKTMIDAYERLYQTVAAGKGRAH